MLHQNNQADNGHLFGAGRRTIRDLKNQHQGQWYGLLVAAGIGSEYLDKGPHAHGPCPACGGEDRFRYDDKHGHGNYICNQCSPKGGDGLNLIMNVRRVDLATAIRLVDELAGSPDTRLEQCSRPRSTSVQGDKAKYEKALKEMRKVWDEAFPVDPADPVWLYLTKTRNLRLVEVPTALRFHPGLTFKTQSHTGPAMVSALTTAAGEIVQVHRTFLTNDGQKALGKMSKGLMSGGGTPMPPGSAIRLFEPGRQLGVTEGIENAIACHQAFGVPTWACYSSGVMHKLIVPATVEEVVIFADNDPEKNGKRAGQEAATKLAERLYSEGKEVIIMTPPTVGRDWCDEITEEQFS